MWNYPHITIWNSFLVFDFFLFFFASFWSNVSRVSNLKIHYLCPNSKVAVSEWVSESVSQWPGLVHRAARAAKNILSWVLVINPSGSLPWKNMLTAERKKCSFALFSWRCAELILEQQFNYQHALGFFAQTLGLLANTLKRNYNCSLLHFQKWKCLWKWPSLQSKHLKGCWKPCFCDWVDDKIFCESF